MKLNSFIKSYAEEINGNFSEYDEYRSVIVVPLDMDRQQAVVAEIDPDTKMITISSKVCIIDDRIRFKNLLEENSRLVYGKFAISNDFLRVESKSFAGEISATSIKKSIQEIAKMADRWELNMTGRDIF